jgi:hypothetical protein
MAILLGALLALVGCEKKMEPAATTKAESGQDQTLATPTGRVPSAITVELLAAGSEPRTALRYDFAGMQKMTVEMVMEMTMGIELGGAGQPPMPLPPVHMDMVIEPKQVSAEGNLSYRFELTDAKVIDSDGADPQVVAAMEAELAKTKGLSGDAEVTPRGFTLKADIRMPPGAGPQVKDLVDKMKTQIEQMSAPLPEEPVGQGASWIVTQPVVSEMLTFTQQATYTLTGLKDGQLDLAIQVKQSAPPQNINAPGMGNAAAKLLSLQSTGAGTSQVHLQKLVPRAEISNSMKMEVEIRAGGQQQNMKTSIDIKMVTRPK